MRMQAVIISFMLALSPVAAVAGSDHDHGHDDGHGHSHDPVTQSQAEQVAIKSIAMLIDEGKIDSS